MPLQRGFKSIRYFSLTFISEMICWKSPPRAEHSLSKSSSISTIGKSILKPFYKKNILFHSFPKSMLFIHIFFTQSKCFSQKSLTFCAFLFCDHISLRPLQTHFQLSVVHFLRRYSSTVISMLR